MSNAYFTRYDALMDRRSFLAMTSALLVGVSKPFGMFLPKESGAREQSDSRPIIAMVLYPEFTALDLVGPYQFLCALEGYRVVLVSEKVGPVITDTGMAISSEMSFKDCPTEVAALFIPGGTMGTIAAMKSKVLMDFVKSRAKTAKLVTSVCTGSLILAHAGILKGKRATSHWLVRDTLSKFGATPTDQRVVTDGNVVTGAGVSAGLDLGLFVIDKLAGSEYAKQCQLWFEYDPKPMHNSGTPAKSKKADVEMLREMVPDFRKEILQLSKIKS
jgi:putative intracellular protease/amidase